MRLPTKLKPLHRLLAAILLLPSSLSAETGTEIVLTYPKVVPQNDTERAMLAYRDGKTEIYRAMVDKYGPNIAMKGSVICSSILGMAVRKNDTDEIERLISLGADTTICANRPINVAISQGRVEALKLLLEAGSPADRPNSLGKRPLETALEQFPIINNYDPQPGSFSRHFVEGYITIVELLLEHGADTSLKTKEGLTYADFFIRQFDGKAHIHPDYEKYKKEILRLIEERQG